MKVAVADICRFFFKSGVFRMGGTLEFSYKCFYPDFLISLLMSKVRFRTLFTLRDKVSIVIRTSLSFRRITDWDLV